MNISAAKARMIKNLDTSTKPALLRSLDVDNIDPEGPRVNRSQSTGRELALISHTPQ